MQRIRVTVTKEHVRNGTKKERENSPVAVALKQEKPNCNASIGYHTATIRNEDGGYECYTVSPSVRLFLQTFNQGEDPLSGKESTEIEILTPDDSGPEEVGIITTVP